MDEVTVNKERLVRFQNHLTDYRNNVLLSPYRAQVGLTKLIKEIDDILTGQPSTVEEGAKRDKS